MNRGFTRDHEDAEAEATNRSCSSRRRGSSRARSPARLTALNDGSTNLRVGNPGWGTGSEHLKNKGTAFAQSRVIPNLHVRSLFFAAWCGDRISRHL